MSEYSLQQQNIISQYRQSNNLGFVISDDEVVSIMQKEMQKTGKVYPGFENLAVSKKNNNESKKADIPSPIAPNNNLFGAVGIKDLSIGVTLERSKNNYATILPTQSQTDAINFLKDITNEADAIVKEQDKESGVLSSVVNTWQELFNKEYAKSTVKKELSKTQQDIALLEKSSKGEPIAYDFLGNPKVSTFEETFRSTRGVEFNEKNIQDCQEKAQDYAQVKTAVEIINKTKSKLSFTTKGDVASQMNPESASRAIIDAFKLAGVNSKEEINKTLKDINEKYKDHPDVKKYGGDFRLAKNKQGKYVIYRTAQNGYPAEATNEELKLIAKEMSTRLDKSLATALGIEYKEDATAEELSTLTQNTLERYQKDYEASFKKAYGKKDLKVLSEEYVQKQQQGVANIEMGLNIASMALMVVPGGAVATSGWALKGAVALKSTTTGAKVVKGLSLVDKAKKGVKIAQTLQKAQQVASPVIMANMTLRPTELLEQLSSENGMSEEEWQAWGEGVLQNSVYMTAGMGASKIAEQGSALYKTKELVNTLKKAGKSADEISAMVKANPVKFPNEIVKSFKKIDTLAKTLQVSSEVALDISSTYLLNKVMGNGDVTKQDWINSVAFAISGGVLQKQFAHLNTESKVKYIHDAFKEYGVTKEEAQNILKTMDAISEGKIHVKKNIDNTTNEVKPREELSPENSTSIKEYTPKSFVTNAIPTVKSIKAYIENTPELKNNKWIQDNIETLLDVCNDANNSGAPLVNLKEKMLHPLLKQHRLEILNTFLSDPKLYNDKQLQQGIKNLLYTYDAKSSKERVESLKWYANLKDAEIQNTRNGMTLQMLDTNNLKDSYAYCLLTNNNLSLENKKLIYEYIYKNNSFELNRHASKLRELCYNISNKDDINFLLNHFGELANNSFFERFFVSGQSPEDAKAKISMYEYFKSINEDLQNDDIFLYITSATQDNANFIKENYNNPEWKDYLPDILYSIKDYNSDFAKELMQDETFPKELISKVLNNTYEYNIKFVRDDLYKNSKVSNDEIATIARVTSNYQKDFCRELIANDDFPNNQIAELLNNIQERENFDFARMLYYDPNIPKTDLVKITNRINCQNIGAKKEIYNLLSKSENFPKEYISKILAVINDNATNKDYAIELCKTYNQLEIPVDKVAFLVENYGKISPKQLQKLNRIIGKNNVANLSDTDLVIACQVADLYKKTNINEIPIEGKKEALRSLVACNEGLFNISPEMQKMFPMLPTNREAYCSLLPSIVRSLGIETNALTATQTSKFNQSVSALSETLAKISDSDFANLKITQEYTKDDFIRNVLKIVKDLPAKERQKVYDYFGFELHHNKNNQTGFSIKGYPVNLNNGKKLAQITDPRTKEIVELLRPEVIKFSEQNSIKCNNQQIEQLLNDVVDVLPELRAQIGKSQHGNNGIKGSHQFDLFQHSLKVMQKLSQDPQFKTLNKSDQKVMMLASFLHDITKREGSIDKTHANESAFDTFFIAKKFKLTREEEIKLYTLAKHHEWLEFVNTSKSEEQLTKRLQSVAYDLQNDNLFDMALMFTHADLRAVKVDDTFHDTTVGSGRKTFDGTVRSYGESANVYAKRIQNYIHELQKSQPLLPVTKIPAASKIAEAITVVRPDGSTNIKGVYKDKDGLIVIKYNEVEDWEVIGFPKGSISIGIEAKKGINYGDEKLSEDVNTGNIKFFAHGLDYENQLAKFDAFSLVDSDVLLSISYAERPESKYRFFRPQGVLLDFDTKYIHGGGNTDAGSGCGKSVADFKKDYIFGGNRESDRVYVSNLIKKATGMNDTQYVEFIKENKNKPLSAIEPTELREKIIRAFASINSNTRKGSRSYNEMYGSNPKKVMAVFAYDVDPTESYGNPIEFLNRKSINRNERLGFGKASAKSVSERTEFLRRYALNHDISFIVFGD